MRVIQKKTGNFVLKLERGEELIGELTRFARSEKLIGAWFVGFGGAEEIEIAYYDLKKKKYFTKRFRGTFEILNITGNIAKKSKGIIIHVHGAFSKSNYQAIGGHIFRCVTAATCEIYLQKLSSLRRSHDPKTDLNLLTN